MKVGDIVKYIDGDQKDVGLVVDIRGERFKKAIILWAADGHRGYLSLGDIERYPDNFTLIKT